MIAFDEDALICDMAETYGVFDYRQLPVSLCATLAVGLRDDSRIKMKLSHQKIPLDQLLQAQLVDGINALIYVNGGYGKNKPPSIVRIILGNIEDENQKDMEIFETPEDFERERKRLIDD